MNSPLRPSLTEKQKDILSTLVNEIRSDRMPEEFIFIQGAEGLFLHHELLTDGFMSTDGITVGALEALGKAGLIYIEKDEHGTMRCTITGDAYAAIDSDFCAPDTSFVKHLSPLGEIGHFDVEIKSRCLPILGAGSANPKMWDSALRTAGVILEERLRDCGGLRSESLIGKNLVNRAFAPNGTLAAKFQSETERESYRDLYAGIVGMFRNPSAHFLLDPTPENAGAVIVFIDLLLTKLAQLVARP